MDRTELIQRYQRGDRTFEQVDLCEQTLMGINLSHSQMPAARFAIANLSSANLSHCSLNQADFNVARLSGANLSQAQLMGAQFNVTNLVRAILTGANLSGSSMVRAEATRCELSQARLHQANLVESDLREAHLRGSVLTQADLSRVNLHQSCLADADLSEARLAAADLTQADLQRTDLQLAGLEHAQLTQANLRGASLRGACLRWANLRGADLSEADLTGAKLSGADLTGANLRGANLTGASFIQANLHQANLMHAQWHQADLSEAQLTGAKLYGSSRFHLKTRNLHCEWVDLSADGSGQDLCYFRQSEEIHTFFDRVQPTVQVLINAPLSLPIHAALAQSYADIAAAGRLPLSVPPSIAVDHRQTRLQFALDRDRTLFGIACGATLPFLCHRLLLRHLALLAGQLQTCDTSAYAASGRQQLSVMAYALVDLCHSFPQYAQLSRQRIQQARLNDGIDFAAQPLQVTLTNSRGRQLNLYRSPGWGSRCAPVSSLSRATASGAAAASTVSSLIPFLSDCHVEAIARHPHAPGLGRPG